jgi:hypothetical protein
VPTQSLRASQLLALLQSFLRHFESSNWIWFAPMGCASGEHFSGQIGRRFPQIGIENKTLTREVPQRTGPNISEGEKTAPLGE